MKTLWNEMRQIEDYLAGKLSPADALLFEASALINPMLKLNLQFQKQIMKLVKLYGRRRMKEEIEAVHQKLFSEPEHLHFQQTIQQLFSENKL